MERFLTLLFADLCKMRRKGSGELISNVKLMTGWEQGSEPLILNIQTTDGSDRLTSTSDQGRSWEGWPQLLTRDVGIVGM